MKGIKLINSVIFKFTKLISKLEKGIELIEEEQENNVASITNCYNNINSLEEDNIKLEMPKATAKNVIDNLKKLLGETND